MDTNESAPSGLRALFGSAPRSLVPYLFPIEAAAAAAALYFLEPATLLMLLVYCLAVASVLRYEGSRLIATPGLEIPQWFRRLVVVLAAGGVAVTVLHELARTSAFLAVLESLVLNLAILFLLPFGLPPALLMARWLGTGLGARWNWSPRFGYEYVAVLLLAAGLASPALLNLILGGRLTTGIITVAALLTPAVPYALSQPLWSPSLGALRSVGMTLPFWQAIAVAVLPIALSSDVLATTPLYALWGASGVVWIATQLEAVVAPLATTLVRAAANYRQSRLGIQPDVATYVDLTRQKERLQNFIRDFDSAVIGITGVRGAGKSALITAVTAEFEGECFVLRMTSPVRHEGGIAFLATVCRSVCEKVLDDTAGRLGRLRTAGQLAQSESRRRIGIALLALVGLILGAYWGVFAMNRSRSALQPLAVDQFRGIAESLAIHRMVGEIDGSLREPWTGFNAFRVDFGKNHRPFVVQPVRVGEPMYGPRQAPPVGDSVRLGDVLRFKESLVVEPALDFVLAKGYEFPPESVEAARRYRPPSRAARTYGDHLADLLRVAPVSGLLRREASELVIRAILQHHPQWLVLRPEDLGALREVLAAVERSQLVGAPQAPFSAGVTDERRAGATALVLSALALLAVVTYLLWNRIVGWVQATLKSSPNQPLLAALKESEKFLELLSYQTSAEESAGFSWRGLEIGRKRGLAERELTLSGLTQRYVEFVTAVKPVYNNKLIIAIDELDKIHDPQQVKDLLIEIKGALFVSGCIYLLSISDDAAQTFGRRLSAGRDILESTFDDIIDIPRMNGDHAFMMASARVGLAQSGGHFDPAIRMLNVLSAGVPRELIRNLRHISGELAGDWPQTAVAHRIVRRDLGLWLGDVPEMPLGPAARGVRNAARKAFDAIGPTYAPGAAAEAWAAMEECLRRLEVGAHPASKAEVADPDGRGQACGHYRRECLRLLLALTAMQAAEQGALERGAEDSLLEIGMAVEPNPDLAMELLTELRGGLGF